MPIDWLIDNMTAGKEAQQSAPSLSVTTDDTTTITNFRPIKGRTTFETLPGELRNRIYDLSGCLRYWEIRDTPLRTTARGDSQPRTCPPMFSRSGMFRRRVVKHVCLDGCARLEHRDNCRAAYLIVNGKEIREVRCFTDWRGMRHTPCHEATIAQPALTTVSKLCRQETLSIFYGDHPIVAKLNGDGNRLLEWLDTIGAVSAGHIRRLYLIYSRKEESHYIDKELRRELRMRGLSAGEQDGVLRLVRVSFPYKCDEASILKLLDGVQARERKGQKSIVELEA